MKLNIYYLFLVTLILFISFDEYASGTSFSARGSNSNHRFHNYNTDCRYNGISLPSFLDGSKELQQQNSLYNKYIEKAAMVTACASVGVGIGAALYGFCQNYAQDLCISRESQSHEDAIRQEGLIIEKYCVKLTREVRNLKESSEYREASPDLQSSLMQRLFNIIEHEKIEDLSKFRSKRNDKPWSSYLDFWGLNKKITQKSEEVEGTSLHNAIAAIDKNDLAGFIIAISDIADWENLEQEKLINRTINCIQLCFIKEVVSRSEFADSAKNVTGKLLLNYAFNNQLRPLQDIVLLGNAPINFIDSNGYSALDIAVKGNNLPMIEFLVKNGALVRKGSYSQVYIYEIKTLLPNLCSVTPSGRIIYWLEQAIEE